TSSRRCPITISGCASFAIRKTMCSRSWRARAKCLTRESDAAASRDVWLSDANTYIHATRIDVARARRRLRVGAAGGMSRYRDSGGRRARHRQRDGCADHELDANCVVAKWRRRRAHRARAGFVSGYECLHSGDRIGRLVSTHRVARRLSEPKRERERCVDRWSMSGVSAGHARRSARPRNAVKFFAVALTLCVVAIASCSSSSTTTLPPFDGALAIGTWGGDSAAMIVGDTAMHIHVGCTFGDVSGRVPVTNDRFDVNGSYMLRAFPIALGPAVPARFVGRLDGATATLTITVNDT